jgi:protein-disulfide isomerase
MPLLKQVLDKYPEQVKVVFKNFPLRNHQYARKAAAAALAADKQGKFWEFEEQLFKHSRQLNDDTIQQIVSLLGLNKDRFKTDWKDPQIEGRITKDIQDGAKAGVKGTPTIFVNGRLLRQRSIQGFQIMIDKELNQSR